MMSIMWKLTGHFMRQRKKEKITIRFIRAIKVIKTTTAMRATRLRKVLTTNRIQTGHKRDADRSVGAVASHRSVLGMGEKKE